QRPRRAFERARDPAAGTAEHRAHRLVGGDRRVKPLLSCTLIALATLAGCDAEEVMPPGTLKAPASARPPLDRLAAGELAEGRAAAFGLRLPRELVIDARFPGEVHASGPVAAESVANYVRARVDVSHVEIGA